jgi:hypothetical protein
VLTTVIRWALAGFVDVMRCELTETPVGCALGLRMGDELILAELWPSVEDAQARAEDLRGRLLRRGWLERI